LLRGRVRLEPVVAIPRVWFTDAARRRRHSKQE